MMAEKREVFPELRAQYSELGENSDTLTDKREKWVGARRLRTQIPSQIKGKNGLGHTDLEGTGERGAGAVLRVKRSEFCFERGTSKKTMKNKEKKKKGSSGTVKLRNSLILSSVTYDNRYLNVFEKNKENATSVASTVMQIFADCSYQNNNKYINFSVNGDIAESAPVVSMVMHPSQKRGLRGLSGSIPDRSVSAFNFSLKLTMEIYERFNFEEINKIRGILANEK